MAKTLGSVSLKLEDEVLVRVRTNTTIVDLLEQLDKACKDGRIQDVEGFDVTAHYSQDLKEIMSSSSQCQVGLLMLQFLTNVAVSGVEQEEHLALLAYDSYSPLSASSLDHTLCQSPSSVRLLKRLLIVDKHRNCAPLVLYML